ncbi:MAG: SIS domain-containing protein [Rubellimicrobium sp.]|nr:SIS domain-containing protein [Rubellimicrobium sp.]
MSDPLSRWQTWREIMAQPAIWGAWAADAKLALTRGRITALAPDEVWFTGAGSSAYIGDMVCAGLEGQSGPRLRAVPTTDLVSRPRAYLNGRRPLVVSFGRSGNSAETLGTLDALDALAPAAPRLNITCNGASALAQRAGRNGHVIVLPEATHDQGFAMTSSLTTMVLTALALFDAAPDWSARMARAAEAAAALLPRVAQAAQAARLPERIVFVGAGPLAYAARESALKVMELTAGQVPALWDSSLGFRHGPKSFVVGQTDIVVLTSPDDPAALYDADLVAELRAQFPDSRVTAIGPGGDIDVPMPDGAAWGAPLAVLYAQCLCVALSDRLGLSVDDPFAGKGTLSRVVAGVKLHPVAP